MHPSILISSAGAKIPLIDMTREALSRTQAKPRIICGDSNSKALSAFFCDEFWLMKPLDEYQGNELLFELKKRNIVLVIPTRDAELKFWAERKDFYAESGVHVLVSGIAALKIALDKLEFTNWLRAMKMQFIETREEPSFDKDLNIVIKERFSEAPKNTLIKVPSSDSKALSAHHRNPIFQEYIEGREISVDLWVHDSGHVDCLARTRDLIVDGEARVTSVFRNEAIHEISKEIAMKIGILGPCVIQFIESKNGKFYPIECNARIGGASTYSIKTKFDSFYVTICKILREQPSNKFILENKSTQVRVLKDYYFN